MRQFHHIHCTSADLTTNSTIAQTGRWKRFIRDLKSRQGDDLLSKYDVARTFTATDLQCELDAALREYEDRGTTWSNPLNRIGRSVGDNASSFEVVLKFLPTGEYTSILCGAMTMIVRVCLSQA